LAGTLLGRAKARVVIAGGGNQTQEEERKSPEKDLEKLWIS